MSAEFENLLKDIAAREGMSDYIIERTDGSEKGDGYIGVITGVKIVGKDENGKENILHLIVKSASQNEALRSETPVATVFDREIYMYDTVFRVFQQFEEEKGLPPSHFAPKFYKGQRTHNNEALVLENLKESNYRLFERRIPMDEHHVALVMREYARLHALSLALRDQDPVKLKTVAEPITDELIPFFKKTKLYLSTCVKAQKSLKLDTDTEAIAIYETFLSNVDHFLDELLTPPDNYSVILHADCWTNNMMFKYGIDDEKATAVCFLDFQISKLGSPVLDLAYFFYTCSSKDIISNLEHYMELYYSSLSEYLLKLGSDPDKIFPYSILENHWKKYARFGLIMSALAILAMFTEKNEIVSLTDIAELGNGISNAFDYEIANIDKYYDRMRHIILHHVQNKLI